MEELAHWIGVALATPAAGVVLLASWRAFAARRTPVLTQRRARDPRTIPAQLYALLFGSVLLVVGIVGVLADSSYGTGAMSKGATSSSSR